MELRDMAKMAIQVQEACNATGVAQSFAKIMIALGELTNGTDERNTHPVAILFTYKLAALSGQEPINSPVYDQAYAQCLRLAES